MPLGRWWLVVAAWKSYKSSIRPSFTTLYRNLKLISDDLSDMLGSHDHKTVRTPGSSPPFRCRAKGQIQSRFHQWYPGQVFEASQAKKTSSSRQCRLTVSLGQLSSAKISQGQRVNGPKGLQYDRNPPNSSNLALPDSFLLPKVKSALAGDMLTAS